MPTHDVLAPGHSNRPTSELFCFIYYLQPHTHFFGVDKVEFSPAYAGTQKLVQVTEAPTSISLGEL